MTVINPLTHKISTNTFKSNSVSQNNEHHEKIYQDLQQRAHEAKPNEAKAQMVNENLAQSAVSAVKDNAKDVSNFFNVVKTGKISDNSLGRLNDLGLKAGALLIASYLGVHSKTKTESLMRFIGGGAFLASMQLWPKIFINLPARLVHGFKIDRKYISAQGDKKDFGLDNQFLVWDAIPEQELRQDAARAGIDYDSKNGKEKIQRKEQMVMVQNRALNMATVGGGAVLMTSLFGNYFEPVLKKAVVASGLNKTKKILDKGLDEYLESSPKIVKNVKEMDDLFAQYKGKTLDDEFFKQLADMLKVTDIIDDFKDCDDFTPIKEYTPYNVIEELKNLYKSCAVVDADALRESLKDVKVLDDASALLVDGAVKTLDEKQITSIMQEVGKDATPDKVRGVLSDKGIAPQQIENVIASLKTNADGFMQTIKEYNATTLPTLRGRVKSYLKLVNSTAGSTAESVYTSRFEDSMKQTFKALGLNKISSYKILKQIKKGDRTQAQEILYEIMQEKFHGVEAGSYKYNQLISQFKTKPIDNDTQAVLDAFSNKDNLGKIHTTTGIESLNNAILGNKGKIGSLDSVIGNFINIKNIDTESVGSKAIICANFEARCNRGDFKEKSKEWIESARNLVYNGNASNRFNNAYCSSKGVYEDIISTVLDKNAFEFEETVMPGIQNTVERLKEFKGNQNEQYFKTGSFSGLFKDYAERMYNNKSWMRIFAPIAISLVAVTLLIQPFFGNISKEFPDENKNGGAK